MEVDLVLVPDGMSGWVDYLGDNSKVSGPLALAAGWLGAPVTIIVTIPDVSPVNIRSECSQIDVFGVDDPDAQRMTERWLAPGRVWNSMMRVLCLLRRSRLFTTVELIEQYLVYTLSAYSCDSCADSRWSLHQLRRPARYALKGFPLAANI